MPGYRLFLIIFLAACATIILSPLAVWISRRLGLMDIPRREKHKQHRRPVPLAGGIVLFAAFLILTGLSGAAAQPEFLASLNDEIIWGAFKVVGVDDRGNTVSRRPKYIFVKYTPASTTAMKRATAGRRQHP